MLNFLGLTVFKCSRTSSDGSSIEVDILDAILDMAQSGGYDASRFVSIFNSKKLL